MPTKLANILKKVNALSLTEKNATLLIEFHEYLKCVQTSEKYQNDVLKVSIQILEA